MMAVLYQRKVGGLVLPRTSGLLNLYSNHQTSRVVFIISDSNQDCTWNILNITLDGHGCLLLMLIFSWTTSETINVSSTHEGS